jgi:16S rRNA (uracil1498-N3)-methyltransferase
MHRFFLTTDDAITAKKITINNGELVHQMCKVLRFKPKDKAILLNSELKQEITVEFTELSKKQIQAKIIETNQLNREPEQNLHLFFAILKNSDKVELILQKCTELGITEFTPIITDRTEKKVLPKIERLNRIILEACEQSHRISIPKLNPNLKLSECLNLTGINLVADPYSQNHLSQYKNQTEPTNLFIGPEGGFTPEEIEQFKHHKFQTFQMGQLILRAETACIVASAQILI